MTFTRLGNQPTISVIINTLNRAASLALTLDAFRWQSYRGEFEVIVVNGPSTDNSEAVIAAWSGRIRTAHCPEANLSMSRNIGICMARGDIVAFIDDDGIPEPEWLEQIALAYKNPAVGGAGGRVYNHTGYDFQAEYFLVDRLGEADGTSYRRPMPHRCFPSSLQFPHLLGTNASFRRDVLLAINGFDEEFEYFLDETDVCLRVIDAGWLIRQLPNAYVHHKFAPSSIRTEKNAIKHHYPIVKNKIYFGLKHAQDFFSLEHIYEVQKRFVENLRKDLRACIESNLIEQGAEAKFDQDVTRAVAVGRARGMAGYRKMITAADIAAHQVQFLPFPVLLRQDRLCLVLITRDYPPDHSGGIATFYRDLAVALAAMGHLVHVVCKSADINRVDLESGVWVHRILSTQQERTVDANSHAVPTHIWNWSASALTEVRRIADHRQIDAIEAPILDCQGIAFNLEGSWPLITSLKTSLAFYLKNDLQLSSNSSWMTEFGTPMLRLEAKIMTGSSAIRAISRAVRADVECAHGFTFTDEQVMFSPLGLASRPIQKKPVLEDVCRLLFVGRLEHRKGIDVLLRALPLALAADPALCARIVGEDKPYSEGNGYRQNFAASPSGSTYADRVTFVGRVDDETLAAEYAACDIFVAPSRYESFGLVFLEAMRAGKPVIGCNIGGMPDIIHMEENGLLVPPGDAEALAGAILRLAREPELRRSLGHRGRALFAEKFSAEAVAAESLSLYHLAITADRAKRLAR